MSGLQDKIRSIIDRAAANTAWRQRECFNLIPSENTPSLLVKMCEISDPAGRYAEHRKMKEEELYFYQGIDFIREVEEELEGEFREYFGCPLVEVRPVSGQMANMVLFAALVRLKNQGSPKDAPLARLRCVMNNDLIAGGHLSAQPLGALFNFVEKDPETGKQRVVNFPVSQENPYRTDVGRTIELLEEKRAALISRAVTKGLNPDWISLLLKPIRQDKLDLTISRFNRHWFETPFSAHLVYPLLTTIYNSTIHDPVGAQWGISHRLIHHRDTEKSLG